MKKEKSSKKDKKILGRKRNSDKTERKHNKNGADNIIKKCKGIFFRNVVEYISSFINNFKTNKKVFEKKNNNYLFIISFN